ncbi:MAG: hypothetical protein OWP43_13100 [Sphaerochaetaceae bacterium]|nr:hypothetical protein [Sphaerochaetaceae bacterium]
MNKKILSTLAIVSLAITSLFAYSSPSVILSATAEETDYSFKLQKLNDAMDDYEDFDDNYTENIILDSEGGITNAFTIATTANGNMAKDITFEAEVTTGPFLDSEDASYDTSWYPVIVELSDSATTENFIRGDEEVSYKSSAAGNYTSASTGTFSTKFTRGIHPYGTEIARFKLQYKADENLIAGTYTSTTTINISTK